MTKKDCIGCENDFYNDKNPLGVKECWSFKDAKLIMRKAVPIDRVPPWNQKAIRIPSCYHVRGYVYVKPEQVSRMTNLPTRLARKWCIEHGQEKPTGYCICPVLEAAIREALGEAEKCIPTNWLDPLLTGPRAILRGNGPWDCHEIERLLQGIAAAIAALRAGA